MRSPDTVDPSPFGATTRDGVPGGSSVEHSLASGRPLGADLAAVQSAVRVLGAAVASAGGSAGGEDQAARVDAIRALEDLKDAACAAQAELAVALVSAEVAAAAAPRDAADDGPRARARRVARARRSAIGQVALARRESPHRGRVLVGMAEALVHEMPSTHRALRDGAINEHRATLLVRETACLEKHDRAHVDRVVCADRDALAGLGTRRLVAAAKAAAYRADPHAIVRRAEREQAERCVTLRPAPGSMVYLTALLPLAQGVAALATLQRSADAARAAGDERSRGQAMADTLVERITGQRRADEVPVTVNLVMSDETLLGAGREPAQLDGAHQVPAQLARELVAKALEVSSADRFRAARESSSSAGPPGWSTDPSGTGADPPGPSSSSPAPSEREARRIGAWVRRLYADAGGSLVAMDSRARTFPRGLASLLRIRDQGLCRTPWCDAPVAHLDHVRPAARGGGTSVANGQGLCAGCNYTKQAEGWAQHATPAPSARPSGAPRPDVRPHDLRRPDVRPHDARSPDARSPDSRPPGASRHTVTTVAPTGHAYVSTVPRAPEPIRLRSASAGVDGVASHGGGAPPGNSASLGGTAPRVDDGRHNRPIVIELFPAGPSANAPEGADPLGASRVV